MSYILVVLLRETQAHTGMNVNLADVKRKNNEG
jgi:hypothetical protein